MKKSIKSYLLSSVLAHNFKTLLRSIIICATVGLLTLLQLSAQELSTSKVAFDFNKEALKAAKKGALMNAGAFWNKDKTLLHNFFIYSIKKQGTFFQEFTVDANGKVTDSKTAAYTHENLQDYDLSAEIAITNDDGVGELSGKEYGFFRRPVTAGYPKLLMGAFEDRYVNAVWNGYKFDKGAKTQLDQKFWPAYSFAYAEGVDNTNYLLRKRFAVGRILTQNRRYIPADGQAIIGGVMASTSPKFISGRYDLASKTWVNKVETDISPKSIAYNYAETDKGVMVVLSSPKLKYVLELDHDGNLLHRTDLSMTGNIYALKPEKIEIKTDGEDYFVIAPKFDKPNVGKQPGFVISKIKAGKEVFGKQHNHAAVMASLVKAPKSKQKLAANAHLKVENINKLQSGDYLVTFSNANDPATNYFVHLSSDGDLIKTYQVDGIPGDGKPVLAKAANGSTHLDTEIIEKDGMLYGLIRTVPQEEDMGIHTSTFENDYIKTTTTVRVDELKAKCRLVKIDLKNQSIAKPVDLEGLLIGTLPYSVTKNGTLLLHSRDKKGSQQLLVVK